MGAIHQLASASLTTAFLIGMLVTAHWFSEHQSSRNPTFAVVQPINGPL